MAIGRDRVPPRGGPSGEARQTDEDSADSSGGETRTLNHTINSRVLCRLSYPGMVRRLAGLKVALAIDGRAM